MAYEVKVIPGNNIVLPEDLDENLKAGCDAAAQYGMNIYVCGDPGAGKSSVLGYFKSKAREYFGIDDSKVLFMSDFDFVDAIINGIRNNKIEDFRRKYMEAEMIIIDDIDRLKNKDASQRELVHILETNKLIIISGSEEANYLRLSEEIVSKIRHYTIMQIDNYSEEETLQNEY